MTSEFANESVVGAPHTSAEALKFSLSSGIASQLDTAIDSARKHFSIIGSPSVRLVQDPEVESIS
jgi:hypothetical protein